MTKYKIRDKATLAWLSPREFEFMTIALLYAFWHYPEFEVVPV